jgi:UDP-4-amino-4,6-dideoxy-N-acetyl-beta-L-altrosamine transaminase
MIPYGRQSITQADIDAVVQVLHSDWLTQGPMVPRFEQAVAAKVGAQYGVAVNSATSALHIACLALGLRSGDLLWTVPNTFVASANCGRYCGAEVDFVDIDPNSWNISLSLLREKLAQARRRNRLPKVLVPVHFAGQPCEQEAIWELAQEYDFLVLEDASHAIGACRTGEPVGSCRWSHIAVFSFHPVKIITSGEGGMALTNDTELAAEMEMLRSHAITRDAARMTKESDGPWYYEQQMLGFNYRMTDIQSALGLSQLQELDEFITRRNQLAVRYNQLLADLPLRLPAVRTENLSSFHIYVVRLQLNKLQRSRREIFEALRTGGIGVNVHYMPVHLQPYYQQFGFKTGDFPESERHGATALTLPLYPALTDEQQDLVAATIKRELLA